MKDKERDLDRLIKSTLNEKFEHFPSPPLSINESWDDLQNRKKKTIQPNRKPRFIIAASILFILGSVIFYSPSSGSAFNRLVDVFNKGFTIVEGSEVTSQSMNLDEAQAMTSLYKY